MPRVPREREHLAGGFAPATGGVAAAAEAVPRAGGLEARRVEEGDVCGGAGVGCWGWGWDWGHGEVSGRGVVEVVELGDCCGCGCGGGGGGGAEVVVQEGQLAGAFGAGWCVLAEEEAYLVALPGGQAGVAPFVVADALKGRG